MDPSHPCQDPSTLRLDDSSNRPAGSAVQPPSLSTFVLQPPSDGNDAKPPHDTGVASAERDDDSSRTTALTNDALSTTTTPQERNSNERAHHRNNPPAPRTSTFETAMIMSNGNQSMPWLTPTATVAKTKMRFPPMYYDLKGKVDYFPWLDAPQPCDRILIDVVARLPNKPWIPPIGIAWSIIRNTVHEENPSVFPDKPKESSLTNRFTNLMKFTEQFLNTTPGRSGMEENVKQWLDELTCLMQERKDYLEDCAASDRRTKCRKRLTSRQRSTMIAKRPAELKQEAAETARKRKAAGSEHNVASACDSSTETKPAKKPRMSTEQKMQETSSLLDRLDNTQNKLADWLHAAMPLGPGQAGSNPIMAICPAPSFAAPAAGSRAPIHNSSNINSNTTSSIGTATSTTTTTTTTTTNNNNNNDQLIQLIVNQQQMMHDLSRHQDEDRERLQGETSQLRYGQERLSSDIRSLVDLMSQNYRITNGNGSGNGNGSSNINSNSNSNSHRGSDGDGSGSGNGSRNGNRDGDGSSSSNKTN